MVNGLNYLSTRGGESSLKYEDVLLSGLSRDGGLFMPADWPTFTNSEIKDMKNLSYSELAAKIMSPFIEPSLTCDQINKICHSTYSNFTHKDVAPLHQIKN